MTAATQTPMLEIRDIKRDYSVPQGMFKQDKIVHAVKGVSFKLDKGKTLAIVGESGCGKSTLARILTFIDEPKTDKGNGAALAGNSAAPMVADIIRRSAAILGVEPTFGEDGSALLVSY